MIDGVWVWSVGPGKRIWVGVDERLREKRRRRHEVENDGRDTPFLASFVSNVKPVTQSWILLLKKRNLKMLSP